MAKLKLNKFINTRQENINTVFFYFPLSIWLFSELLIRNTTITRLFSIDAIFVANTFTSLAFLFLLTKALIFQKYTILKLLLMLVVTFIILISFFVSRSPILINSVIFIFACQNVSLKKVAKIIFYAHLIIIPIVFFLSFVNIIPNYSMMRLGESLVRHSLGFRHPNLLGARFLQMSLALIIWKWNKLSFWHYTLVIIFSVFTLIVSDSRSSVLAMISLVLLIIVQKMISNKMLERAFLWLLFILVLLSQLMSIFSLFIVQRNSHIYHTINQLFTGRMYWNLRAMREYGLNLFGNNVFMFIGGETCFGSGNGIMLDNSYVHLAVRFGVLILTIFIIATFLIFFKNVKKLNYAVLIPLTVMSVYGMMELYTIMLSYNLTILYFGTLVFNTRE